MRLPSWVNVPSGWPTWPGAGVWARDKLSRQTIEVAVWHDDRLQDARVCADYAEKALEHAYGNRYDVEVWVREESLDMKAGPGVGHIRDNVDPADKAKDANVFVNGHTDARAGGSVGAVSVDTAPGRMDVAGLRDRPLRSFVDRHDPDAYERISSFLHELGHMLGLQHDDGREVERFSPTDYVKRRYITVMAYGPLENLKLLYSEKAASASIEVK